MKREQEMKQTIEVIIGQIKNDANIGFKIITQGESYFTVENEEGYRAYMQVERFGGYSFSTTHKPNKDTGSGWRVFDSVICDNGMEDIIKHLNETLDESKRKVICGREKKDTRKPHESGKYLA